MATAKKKPRPAAKKPTAALKQKPAKRTKSKMTKNVENADHGTLAEFGRWSDAAREQYETAMQTFTDNAAKFRMQTEETFESTRAGFEAASEKLKAAGVDAMSAARQEMTDAVCFANDLARAKTVGDALEVQRDYWVKLFETRAERARTFAEVSAEATRDAFEPMSRSFAAAFSTTTALDKLFPLGTK